MAKPRSYDAFPNAPGLSKQLGLTKSDKPPRDTKGWGPWRRRWFSICSAHRFIDPECECCRVGRYHVAWRQWFSRWLRNR